MMSLNFISNSSTNTQLMITKIYNEEMKYLYSGVFECKISKCRIRLNALEMCLYNMSYYHCIGFSQSHSPTHTNTLYYTFIF